MSKLKLGAKNIACMTKTYAEFTNIFSFLQILTKPRIKLRMQAFSIILTLVAHLTAEIARLPTFQLRWFATFV